MSGTAFGTVVLHVSPEAAAGGPLALVRDGDRHPARRQARGGSTSWSTTPSSPSAAREWTPPPKPARGYTRLYIERVTQAEHGCDFDFLAGTSDGDVR